jgi:peroxiredoxin
MAGKGNGRQPLQIIGGVVLIGAALFLLFFGRRLLSQNGAEPALLSQIPALANLQTGEQFDGLLQAGESARDFILNDTTGRPVQLSSLSGQPVILNFWATWCGPCRVEMPDLQAAFERHQADGLVILAINREETAVSVRDFFYDELDLTFTPLLDEAGDVARLYGVANYPTSVFVNSDGVVTAVHLGLMTEEQIEGYLADTIYSSEVVE